LFIFPGLLAFVSANFVDSAGQESSSSLSSLPPSLSPALNISIQFSV
jgi:hypothetical protein